MEPLGQVNPIGEITYKIRNVKVNKIQFKLVAVNSNISRKTESEIMVANLTYDEIYKEAYDNIKREKIETKETKKSDTIFTTPENHEILTPENQELFNTFKLMGLWVFMAISIGFILYGCSK